MFGWMLCLFSRQNKTRKAQPWAVSDISVARFGPPRSLVGQYRFVRASPSEKRLAARLNDVSAYFLAPASGQE